MIVEVAVTTGTPFMTNGCPDRTGDMACNRPYGSYRPGEAYRDYPFHPNADDLIVIRQQMRLKEVWSDLNPIPA
jgi:biotin synthase